MKSSRNLILSSRLNYKNHNIPRVIWKINNHNPFLSFILKSVSYLIAPYMVKKRTEKLILIGKVRINDLLFVMGGDCSGPFVYFILSEINVYQIKQLDFSFLHAYHVRQKARKSDMYKCFSCNHKNITLG